MNTASQTRQWTTSGFEAFRRGTFGNGGQNLYVSRAGVLQRIHQYDLNADGYVELLFCNSQNHWETPPSYLYRWNDNQFGRVSIPTHGASCADLADLNQDGRPDLFIGRWYDGITQDLNALAFFAGEHGFGEQAMQYLPAPLAISTAIGDFNGDGKADVAIQCRDVLRIFYQHDLGLERSRFTDLPIKADRLASFDLDGDGFADLVVRDRDGTTRILWGGGDGICIDRSTPLPIAGDKSADANSNPSKSAVAASMTEWAEDAHPLTKVIVVKGVPHIFVALLDAAYLVPILPGRIIGQPVRLDCRNAFSIAAADLDGDGHLDLVLACRDSTDEMECSWIFWGSNNGFASQRTPLLSTRASDVVIGDFDGDGRPEIALCQAFTDEYFTTAALIYKLEGRTPNLWQQVEAHDAQQGFCYRRPGAKQDELLLINRQGRNKQGNIPATAFLGGPDGYDVDRRIDLPGWGATVAVCADLNDDGMVDVAFANTAENSVDRDPGSYIYLQTPTGFDDHPSQILATTRAHGIACADIDRDGYLELIFAGFQNNELTIFRQGPDGFDTDNPQRIKLELDGKTYTEVRFLYMADLNHDGWLDLILPLIADDHSLILWGGPNGFDIKRSQKIAVRHACSIRAADLDGDGYLDLVMGGHMASNTGPHDSFAYIFWNGPDGLREDRCTLLPAEAINSMSIADFNNDGHLDLFVGSYGDGRHRRDIDSYLYLNAGGRGFSSDRFIRLFNNSASGDFAADLNGDGWIDLVVANHKHYGDHVGWSRIWWNSPDGFDERRVTLLPTAGPHGMVTPGPGNIMDRSPHEYYISEPHELDRSAVLRKIEWAAKLPPATSVSAQLRTADSPELLDKSTWIGPTGPDTYFNEPGNIPSSFKPSKFVQYRLRLSSPNSAATPRVTSVTLAYDVRP
ncbi:MAG: VCBS repeat-containing protein [Phycisphaerales bacterium]|jgi:hypothetical protein|nr:VCBS repeat-containing protein [Phycisphaerales bacterium]